MVAALPPFHPYPRGAPRGLPFEWSVATVRAGRNFSLTTTRGDVDLLGDIAGGGSYDEMLIRVKRAPGRTRHFEVIAELEALAEEIGRHRGKA